MGGIDVAIGVDADCVAGWLGSYSGTDSPADLSRGPSTGNGEIPRTVQLFGDEGIDTTWYTSGHTIETFHDEVEAVAAGGREIGVHGYSHEDPTDPSQGQEDAIIEKSTEFIEDVTGDPLAGRCTSWWGFSKNMPELVEKHGFLYDSGLMERGFESGYMRKDDNWTKIQYEQDAETQISPRECGAETGVVEVPINWYRNDIPSMLFVKQPLYHSGYKDPNMMYGQHYKEQFEYPYNRRGAGVYAFTIHPDLHSLPHMIPFLEDFIQYAKNHEGAEFKTLEVVARKYRDDPNVHESEGDYV